MNSAVTAYSPTISLHGSVRLDGEGLVGEPSHSFGWRNVFLPAPPPPADVGGWPPLFRRSQHDPEVRRAAHPEVLQGAAGEDDQDGGARHYPTKGLEIDRKKITPEYTSANCT